MSHKRLVTGVAGFFGSHLAERLLEDGHEVRGVDGLLPYRPRAQARALLDRLAQHPRFEFVEADLRTHPVPDLLRDVGTVFHFAAFPGVPGSWGDAFGDYLSCNVMATQRLLEACRATEIDRFVFASSGSVYGESTSSPVEESELPRPFSPYSLTKLAAENLCSLYAANWGVPVVSLRYFYGFGPRQRSDVALYRMVDSCLRGVPFTLLGDGSSTRDLVYVGDIVNAAVLAAIALVPDGTVVNVCTGVGTTVAELIELVGDAIGRPLEAERRRLPEGYVPDAVGSGRLAAELLGWKPATSVAEGLAAQIAWQSESLR